MMQERTKTWVFSDGVTQRGGVERDPEALQFRPSLDTRSVQEGNMRTQPQGAVGARPPEPGTASELGRTWARAWGSKYKVPRAPIS